MNRTMHNDYDYRCIYWYGDRSPARNRKLFGGWKPFPITMREMNGSPVMLDNHRCFICNPYNESEEQLLLGWS